MRINITSGFKLKALADFPTLSRSHIISFIAKSSLSCSKERNKDDITVLYDKVMTQKHRCVTNIFLDAYQVYKGVWVSNLGNELNYLDKDVERHVSRNDAS